MLSSDSPTRSTKRYVERTTPYMPLEGYLVGEKITLEAKVASHPDPK